jgi:hypothetical protein
MVLVFIECDSEEFLMSEFSVARFGDLRIGNQARRRLA